MSDFIPRIEELSPKQRELLMRRMTKKAKELTGAEEDEIPRVRREGNRFSLSFSQLRQWILDKLEPGTAAYNLPFPLRLQGALDTAALERGLNEIVRRHETLRTTFASDGEEPVQVVHPHEPVRLPFTDLSGLPARERSAELRRRIVADAEAPFDLERGPLVRLHLLRLGEEDHALFFTLHHIISDGWSRGVIFRELETLYDAFREGREPELEELPIQYADFALWQRAYLSGERLEKLLGYWRRQLEDEPPVLELPADRPRRATATSAGGSVALPLPAGVCARLHELSRTEKASLFMTSMAAFKALLYRHTGQSDLTVGTFIANRNRRQVAPLIGFFVNTLVLRSRLQGGATFRETLRREREVALAAYEHQDLPFEQLLEELRPERNTAVTPFFQTTLVLQNMRRKELSLAGLEVSHLGAKHGHVDFDLTVWLREVGDVLTLVLDYRRDLFDAPTAERLAGRFERLLTAVAGDADRRLQELPLLSPDEERQVLREWNETAAPAPTECVHRLFEEQARRTPEAPALEDAGSTLSYAELDAAANRLAHRLVASGVGPDVLVAVSLPRSPHQVVALLAVLKAGGAYLPLDPDYPRERRAYMLADSGTRRVISDSGFEEGLAEVEVIRLDAEEEAIAALPPTPPDVEADLENAAYVIYTSGSTGRPKGVVVPHRALANYTLDAAAAYGLRATDRALQFATVNFDTSAEEIYPTLLTGATLVLRTEEMIVSVAELLHRLEAMEITLLNLPTAYWHQICSELRSGLALPGTLRRVILGGEKAAVGHLVAWQEKAGDGVGLVNTYGPTEATIVTTRCELAGDGAPRGKDLQAERREIPLGRPLRNARTYVLDRHRRPLAVRSVGEIAIGGAGLARGYLGRPALTAERFVPDPFATTPGERLYLSGDLGTWRADGQLEYRGRADHQVKLRGFRVELGEIESELRRTGEVRDAVVVARAAGEDLRLVAYVVPAGERPPVAALKSALTRRLPEYMVPAVFLFLDALPTTPGGKLDRRALPAPTAGDVEREREYVAPRTTAETLLAGIWEELLHAGKVGAEDDFFELGGHSLLATRLVARIRDTFDAEVPLLEVFDSPTLADMARVVERLENVDSTPLPPLKRLPRDETTTFPLSLPQERIWVLNELQGDNLAYHFVFVLRLVGDVDTGVLRRCLDELVRRHEIYRTTFHQDDGPPHQVVQAMPVQADCESVDLRHLPTAEGRRRALEIAAEAGRRRFDVRRLPLVRWILMPLDGEVMLAQVEHHFVHDGWSVAVSTGELQTLYEAFLEGRPSPLPELEVQFGDFAHWQQELLRGPYYEKLRDYWVGKVGDAEQVLELPADFPRPRVNRFEGRLVQLPLDDALYRRLREFGLKTHTSLYVNMLAAFYALLFHYTGQKSLLVGSAIANRRLKEAEALVGMIVNTILLRGDVGPGMTFRQLQAQVRRTVLEAHAHQDMPFERLVGALNPTRDTSRNPLFQVMFAFHDSPVPDIDFAGLRGEIWSAHNSSAKADLNVVVIPKLERRRGIERKVDAEGFGYDELLVNWEYNTDLFERSTVERMVKHFEVLLEGLITHPDRTIAETPMTLPEEEEKIRAWRAGTDLPAAVFAHEGLTRQAAARGEAVAVEAGEGSLTYAELEKRSNRLAHLLLAEGLRPQQLVAVSTERSPDLLVAFLAVLKAGGTYVPVDPDFPPQRVAAILEDTGASFLLTLAELAPRFPEHAGRTLLLDREDTSGRPATPPDVEVAPEGLAYVLHTSGSTGRPKGVAITHANLANLLAAMLDAPGLDASDTLLAVITISFDMSVFELYLPLAAGARIVLADRESTMDGEKLMALLERSGATVMQATPVTWQMLFAAGWSGRAGLKVLCGGEAMPPELAARLLDGCGEVWNAYGPTESTVYAALHQVREEDLKAASIPIGRPVANSQVHVLDAHMRPTPVGVPGGLWLAGDSLAQGYFGQGAQTADRFRPDPFSGRAGGRLYRTGDRVRYLADGALAYLGRLDHQVKVRGFRIELGEVETALDRHEAIRQAVVVPRPDATGTQLLVAYYVAEDGVGGLPAAELREHLRRRLPEYMVPAAFVPLEAFPLTPNGKVDRKVLSSWEAEHAAVEGAVEPRTPLEEEIRNLWREFLRRDGFGVHDSFFDLGGHSLLATQLLGRLTRIYGLRISLLQLFEHPTIAEVAQILAERRAEGGEEKTISAGETADAAELVARAEGLDDAELDALLGSMMQEER